MYMRYIFNLANLKTSQLIVGIIWPLHVDYQFEISVRWYIVDEAE